ncbi:MAG: hypothetical protein ACI4SW_01720 [Thermoguttaceae bacterium]|nr:hypothetical protein [Thermoguttaceae bacterium]
MNSWHKVVILLVIISLMIGGGGYLLYKSKWVKPREAIAKQKEELVNAIEYGKASTKQIEAQTQQLQPLYTRSFPRQSADAALQYEIWLSQMLEFCNIRESQVTRGAYSNLRNLGLATQNFRVQAKCQLLDLTQFLYEFYWTPFLHRISTLDIIPQEGSDDLQVAMTIQGLTILYLTNPQQQFPLRDQLPLAAQAPQQLASGPFAAYKPLGELDVFRAVRTGVDQTALTRLTATPVITDDEGNEQKVTRWNLEAESRTISLKIGDVLKVGSFVANIADIDDNLVILRQQNGLLWAVPLGNKLSEAVAVPPNLF